MAVHANSTTNASRRSLLGSLAVLATAPQTALAGTKAGIGDPVLPLYQRALALDRQKDEAHERFMVMRNSFAAKYGESLIACQNWRHDARYTEFDAAGGESDDLLDQYCVVLDEIMVTSPTTAAGLLAKVQAALRRSPVEPGDPFEKAALGALRDTAAFLAGVCAEVRS